MPKATPLHALLAIAIPSLLVLSACNNQITDIPFPVSDSGYAQPVSQPLKFTEPRKIIWDTIHTGHIKPTVSRLDIDALPSTPYDPKGFQPLTKSPEVVHLNMNALPDSSFRFDQIPSKSLDVNVAILPRPTITKTQILSSKANATLSVTDMSQVMGIPGRNIYCIFQDSHGFIWVGADQNLYRYDGENVESYGHTAVDIIEDREGRIWYISDAGLSFIDLHNGTTGYTRLISAPYPRVPNMIVDHEGKIWITTVESKGVEIVDPETMTFKHMGPGPGISGDFCAGIYEDPEKNIWIATSGGIDILNPAKNSIRYLKRADGLMSDSLRAIRGDSKGRIWIAYRVGNISVLDPASTTIKHYEDLGGSVNKTVYRIREDRLGRIWIATNRALILLDESSNSSKIFVEADGVQKDLITGLMIDRKQRIWVGTINSGLQMIDQDAQVVNPMTKLSMSSLFEDESGSIWAGTSSNGIQILNNEKKKMTPLGKQIGFNENIIQSIFSDEGKVWVTSDGGIDVIDNLHKTLEHTGKKEGLLSDTVYTMLRDGNDRFWITGPSQGVELVDAQTTTMLHLNSRGGLSDNAITGVKKDKQGNIWVATVQGGIDVIDPSDWTIRYLNSASGLRDTCYRLVMPDSYGRMWLGTDKGVYVADTKLGTLTNISKSNGLSDNYVSSLVQYKDYVVVGTHNKVNLVTAPVPDYASGKTGDGKWKVSIMANSAGLVLSGNSWDVNMVTKTGKYVWGDAGITIINEMKETQDSATTYITGLNIMNQPVDFYNPVTRDDKDSARKALFRKNQSSENSGYAQNNVFQWDSVTGPYNTPEDLQIPHDRNYIQFHFAQTHFGKPESVLYSYILLGIDKHWSAFENKTFTDNYLNLSPGNYVFKVRSRELTGLWTAPAVLSFSILPPWWKTWWAYTLFVLAIGSLFWAFIHYRSQQLVRENRLLEDKIDERTKEVKQQADELSTVNQISQALVGQAGLDDLIHLVGNQLKDLFKANIVYIGLLDKKTKIIHFPYQYGDQMAPLKLGEGLTSKIILTGEPLLINKDVEELTTSFGIDRVGIPAASYLGVPIPVSDEIIGVLSIQSTEKENHFAEKDKRLLATIAANVGVAIRKARLFEEVKLANTEADAARKNAEEANAAKSAFLSTVSHELRTPLTSVLGFAKITKKRLEEKIFPITDKSDPKTIKTIEQISSNLSVVISEGERLTNLINDVLDLAKIEAGKMEWNLEPVRMNDIVERAIAATSSLFEQKNLRLERNIDANLPEISGDGDKLIQVVVNLLSNAVKFTNEGAVTCSVHQKDSGIVVGITDTGIGIAPEDFDKVFEQFKQVGDTLTDKPKGTGLGLPICKEIVEHHHGKIWLESEFGKGSTFYFSVPMVPADEKTVRHIQLNDLVRQLKKRMEQSHPAIPASNATILVVDDDDGIRSLLKQELTEAGYQVEEAANGKEAISKIRIKRPDLVILDVMMPEMNGFDVAAIMKNDPQTMEIPIIILSVVQDKSRGFRIGVDRYLTKPIDTDLLFSEIGDLLEQGKSRKKVMVVDEDSVTVRTLTDVLEAKGYQVVESDGKELMEKAIANQPDIIILNSVISDKQEIVKSLRFEKGLENVLFLIYQ